MLWARDSILLYGTWCGVSLYGRFNAAVAVLSLDKIVPNDYLSLLRLIQINMGFYFKAKK